jgi:hypothetical protein
MRWLTRRRVGAFATVLAAAAVSGLVSPLPAGAAVAPQLVAHNATVTESSTQATYARITVSVAPKPKTTVAVGYHTYPLSATEGRNATEGVDYVRAAGTLRIPAGTKQADIVVRVASDEVAETDELFGVRLTDAVGASLADDAATVTIFDAAATAPSLDGIVRASSSASAARSVVGLATPFTTVSLYATPDCSGSVVGSATPGIERMFSIPTIINGYASFSATAANANGSSSCSSAVTYDPAAAASEGTAAEDVDEDSDADGLTDAAEYSYGSDPFQADTDGDGTADGAEVEAGTDPTSMQTGEFLPGDATTDCTAGATCIRFRITCPAIPDITGELARSLPASAPRGVVLLLGGSARNQFFGDDSVSRVFVAGLVAEGYEVLQAQSDSNWALVDQPYGPAVVSCRAATLVQYAHDAVFAPLGLDAASGTCGFCLGGDRTGASLLAYALNRYGLADVVDRVVLASGPVHVDLLDGCLNPDPRMAIPDPYVVDFAYGYSNLDGPCLHSDASFAPDLQRDSIETSGRNAFPHTVVRFVVSDDPADSVQWRAIHWGETLRAAGTDVQVRVVPDMPHNIHTSPAGLRAFHDALVGD